MIQDALVSLWHSQDSMNPDDFACSGFFVAPGRIVTVKHVLKDGADLWARPEAGATTPYRIAATHDAHAELDVALLRIDVMPPRAIDLSPLLTISSPPELRLHGYFEGALEQGQEVKALNFDDINHHWRLDVKQPQGHSGSPLCVGDRVWGITICRYQDPNVIRGCALACHQFWDWLCELLPELGQAKPPPQWDEWVERARAGMAQAFKRPLFDKFAGSFARHDSGLPEALRKALEDKTQSKVGEACVDALIELAKQSHEAILDGSVVLGSKDCKVLRKSFLGAMGSAARLCLDPEQLHAQGIDPNGELASILDVEAFTVAGGALAMRSAPHESWALGDDHGIPSLKDSNTFELPLELGEGEDRKHELAAAAHKSVAGLARTPECFDDAMFRAIRGQAVSQAKEGKARILVFFSKLAPEERKELQAWVSSTLGVNLMLLKKPDGDTSKLYLCEEAVLLARICEFLGQIYQPEWNVT
jgi:hypothetical protein